MSDTTSDKTTKKVVKKVVKKVAKKPESSPSPPPEVEKKENPVATQETKSLAKEKIKTGPPQMIEADDWDPKRIVLSAVESKTLAQDESKDKGKALTVKRIYIYYRYNDGSIGPLIFKPSHPCFSPKGVTENFDKQTGELTGYSVGCILQNKQYGEDDRDCNDEELKTAKVFDDIFDASVRELIKQKIKYKNNLLSSEEVVKSLISKPLYRPIDDDGELVPKKSPSFYAKIILRRNKDKNANDRIAERKAFTTFYIPESEKSPERELSPLDDECRDSRMVIEPAIVFDSIFIGASLSLQVKLWEAYVNPTKSQKRRLMTSKNTILKRDEDLPDQDTDEIYKSAGLAGEHEFDSD
jgi:hypothetical protein